MQRTWYKSAGVIAFFLSSCSSVFIDVIKTGPDFPPSKDVEFFTDRSKITKPYGALAILHSHRFDCSQKLQRKILDKAKRITMKLGGDAVVYYFNYDEKNPYVVPEEMCYFSGVAIKYVDDRMKNQN